MLAFFRKYQKILFIFITIVIVISFSFFGTFATNVSFSKNKTNKTAFIAINGKKISNQELLNLYHFISTDEEDRKIQPNNWGANSLNDGVIRKDFLKTGLAKILYQSYVSYFKDDFIELHEKEKIFKPYSHPQASYISAEAVWNHAAPNLKANLKKLQQSKDPTTNDYFETRVNLFFNEKKFSPNMLQQYLRYQLKMYNWLPNDPHMTIPKLSLFEYQTIEDWFGRNFVETIAEFIINVSIIAEKMGYKVSKEETLADLLQNSQKSFEEQKLNPRFGIQSNNVYFQYQLQALHMDENDAINAWRKVMLFRRLFNDVGGVVWENVLPYDQFNNYANQTLNTELYELPSEFKLASDKDWHKFEAYLSTIRKSSSKDPLAIPTSFKSIKNIKKTFPELIQKRYKLKITSANTMVLHTKIGLKETWNWELDKKNWDTLVKEFPELKTKSNDREDHFGALEQIEENKRAKIDAFAREQIIKKHPEWIEEALRENPAKEKAISVCYSNSQEPLPGIIDNKAFIKILDSTKNAPVKKLNKFTQDNEHFYNIEVVDSSDDEILTFEEARRGNTLNSLLNKKLKTFYNKSKQSFAEQKQFKNEQGTYKPFTEVTKLVKKEYFKPIEKAISNDFKAKNPKSTIDPTKTANFYPTHRLYKYVSTIKSKIEKNPTSKNSYVKKEENNKESLKSRNNVKNQWKLIESDRAITRNSGYLAAEENIFNQPIKTWSKVIDQPNGEISFFQITDISFPKDKIPTMVIKSHEQLSIEAKQNLMRKLLTKIKERGAIIPTALKENKQEG